MAKNKNTSSDSKDSASKNTLNPSPGSGQHAQHGGPGDDPGRMQEQPVRDQGQFTAQGRPGLQKK